MNKIIFLFFVSLFSSNISFSQSNHSYSTLINEALDLFDKQEFYKSGLKFSEAFSKSSGKVVENDHYNAACAWALANESDSSFNHLFKIANNGMLTDLDHMLSDTDLNSMHDDSRWNEIVEMVRINKEKADAKLDKPLVAMLDSVYQEDQKYRMQLREIQEKYGWESDEMKTHWEIIQEKDSINEIKVTKILDERGWLGADIIGRQGNTALFLVIQHANIETQLKYLPMMREAVKEGKASASGLALLEDRTSLRQGGKQIYGSQIGRDNETGNYYVLPLEDPDHVNEKRAEVGLGTLEDYVARWEIKWDVEEYKKKLPEYEALQNNKK